jgi:hypothetical protein
MLLDAEDHRSEDSESFGRKLLEVVGDSPLDLLGDEFGMIFLAIFAGVLIVYGVIKVFGKLLTW